MPQLLTHYWRALSDFIEDERERRLLRAANRAMSGCACAGDASRADRLEYIALFAQAGYFTMGACVDQCQGPIEAPPSR